MDAGGAASVSITKVSPTLWRLDFILPETYTAGNNIWTGTNTFLEDVTVSGAILAANGGTTTSFLVVTLTAQFLGDVTITGSLVLDSTSTFSVIGTSTFGGTATFNGTTSIAGSLTVNGPLTISGPVDFNFPALGSTQARGKVVADECENLCYLEASGLTTPAVHEYTTPTTIGVADPETQIATPVNIAIPSFACSPQETQYLDVMVRIAMVYVGTTGLYTLRLWGGSIGGNLIDSFTAGPGAAMVMLRSITVALTSGSSLNMYVTAEPGSGGDTPDLQMRALSVKTFIKSAL